MSPYEHPAVLASEIADYLHSLTPYTTSLNIRSEREIATLLARHEQDMARALEPLTPVVFLNTALVQAKGMLPPERNCWANRDGLGGLISTIAAGPAAGYERQPMYYRLIG